MKAPGKKQEASRGFWAVFQCPTCPRTVETTDPQQRLCQDCFLEWFKRMAPFDALWGQEGCECFTG